MKSNVVELRINFLLRRVNDNSTHSELFIGHLAQNENLVQTR